MLPHQWEALTSTADTLMMVAGLGSGKTSGAVMLKVLLAEQNAPMPGMIAEPTIPMLRDVLIPEFRRFFSAIGIEETRAYKATTRGSGPCFRLLRQEKTFELHLGDGRSNRILMRSTHEPENLLGSNLADVILDEAGHNKMTERVYEVAASRVRANAPRRLFAGVGTPEGFGAFYQHAEAAPLPGTHLIRASTYANVFLAGGPEAYIARRLGHMSERDREQYVHGRFIARGGVVYDHYDAARHERACPSPLEGELVMAIDFGVRTSVALFGNISHDELGRETLYIWDEILCRREGTHRMAEKIKDRWRHVQEEFGFDDDWWSWERMAPTITAYTDSSPWQRSDREIIGKLGIAVVSSTKNPGVMDRVYSLNQRFAEDLVVIDRNRAPYVARCLAQQGYDDRGEPEKPEDDGSGQPGLDHGNDALGYLCQKRWPMRAPGGNAVTAYH